VVSGCEAAGSTFKRFGFGSSVVLLIQQLFDEFVVAAVSRFNPDHSSTFDEFVVCQITGF
jgi:hypothetical protein